MVADSRRRAAPGKSDSTALCRLAQELARAQERLAVAQAGALLGVWEWDSATGRVDSTPEMKALFGLPRRLQTGRDLMYIARIHPDDRKAIKRARDRAQREGRAPEMEFRVVLPGSKVRWIENRPVKSIAARAGAPPRMMGVCRDVTLRRQREMELALQSERLRVALSAERRVVFHQDRDLRFTWVANPTLGATEADIVGRTDAEVLGERNAREVVAIKRRVMRTGRGIRQEVRVRRGEHEGWFDLVVEPSRDADGRVNGVVCGATDITERRRDREALELSRRRLRELADHLRDRLEAERAAIARDVHDHIGAMLTGVRLKLAALGSRHADAPLQAELRGIASSVDRAHAATRKVCAQLRPAELEDLGLVESLRAYAIAWGETAGVRVQCRFAVLRREPPVAIATDAFRALQELLTNVARHARAKNVRIALAERDGRLVLRVADDGRGLPRRARAKGFGLEGLRERVAHHGGALELKGPAKGVDARVEIPLRRHA